MTEPQGEMTLEAQVTVQNFSAVLLLKVAQYPFLVLSALLIPRVMGVHAYGEYALFLSIVVMTSSATELGIGQICGRFVPNLDLLGDLRALRRFATGLLASKIALDALLVGPLYLLLWAAYGDQFPPMYFVLAISILVALDLGMVPYGLMFGLNRLNRYALRDPLRRALTLVLVLILYHYFGLYGALISTFFVEASLAILYFVWGRRFFCLQEFRLDLTFLKPYLQFGFVFYLSGGIRTVWEKVGNPLIAYLTTDPRQVALFDIPNQIFLITMAFLLVTIGYLIPIFTRLLVTGKEEKLVVWSALLLKYIFALSTFTVGGFLIAGRELIPVLIGRDYAEVYPNAAVLLLSLFPMAVFHLGYVFCVVYSGAWKYFQALVCALVAFVPAAVVLVPRLASTGAALAMLLSTVVAAVVLAVTFWHWVAPSLQEGAPVILLGVVFVPFWFLRRDLTFDLFLAGIAGTVYLAALLFTRNVRIEEISNVLRAIRLRPEPPLAAVGQR